MVELLDEKKTNPNKIFFLLFYYENSEIIMTFYVSLGEQNAVCKLAKQKQICVT